MAMCRHKNVSRCSWRLGLYNREVKRFWVLGPDCARCRPYSILTRMVCPGGIRGNIFARQVGLAPFFGDEKGGLVSIVR